MTEQEIVALAEKSARIAVKKTFAILGVDVDKPEALEEFRRDLRFSGDLRKFAGRSIMAFSVVIVGGIAAALWSGFKVKIGN